VIVLVMGQLRTPCGRLVQRQYRQVSTADYYRLAGADRDTAGRPSCKTAGGRVVYGGGGIFPDVTLAERSGEPLWLARANELDLPLVWAGSWVTAHAAKLTTAEALARAPTLPADALADFRTMAATKGVIVPVDEDARLQRALVSAIAFAKFGEAGMLRVAAAIDLQILEAVKAFGRAELLKPSR
jgi:carboxyl-terminal processing protease